jgi:hypothetical protein
MLENNFGYVNKQIHQDSDALASKNAQVHPEQ